MYITSEFSSFMQSLLPILHVRLYSLFSVIADNSLGEGTLGEEKICDYEEIQRVSCKCYKLLPREAAAWELDQEDFFACFTHCREEYCTIYPIN